jgi:hypothetical protein
VQNIEILSTGADMDGLFGAFTDDAGNRAFMINNLYHHANATPAQALVQFRLTFDNGVNRLMRVRRDNGYQDVINLTDHQVTLNLPGGTAVLFFYDVLPSVWSTSQAASWTSPNSWTRGIVDRIDGAVEFAGAITAPRTVVVDSPVTVGTMRFNNSSNMYNIAGVGSLTLQTSTGNALIDVQSGTHKINLPLTVASNANFTVAPGSTLILGDPVTVAAGKIVTQGGGGIVRYDSTVKLNAGAKIQLASTASVASLSMAETASIDVTDNAMVVHGGTYGDVRAKVIDGSITSSAARDDDAGATAVGVLDNGEMRFSDFAGVSGLDGDEALVAYTFYGDTDLSGIVDLTDIDRFALGYDAVAASDWFSGDFDYNGEVDLVDFDRLMSGLRGQGGEAVTPAMLDALLDFGHAQGVAVDVTWVPEPAGLTAVGALAALLVGRRRR